MENQVETRFNLTKQVQSKQKNQIYCIVYVQKNYRENENLTILYCTANCDPATAEADLVFVLDQSLSITENEWKSMLSFTVDVIE